MIFLAFGAGRAMAEAGDASSVTTNKSEVEMSELTLGSNRVNRETDLLISTRDRSTIRKYFSDPRNHIPDRLENLVSLSDDVWASLEQTGMLPADFTMQTLPRDLLLVLTPIDPTYERVIVGRSLFLTNRRTGRILDAMRDIASKRPDTFKVE